MKRFILSLALICAPVFASADAHRSDCAAAVEMVAQVGEAAFGEVVAAQQPAAGDICQIVFASDALTFVADLQMQRNDDVLTVDVSFDRTLIGDHGFEGGGAFDYDLTTQFLTIKRFSARAEEGYGVDLRGEMVLGDADDIMARLTGARLLALSVQHFVTPSILNDLGLQGDMLPCAVISDDQAAFGCAALSRQSRREILRFADVVPDVTGRFDIDIAAADGMPVAAIVTPFIGIAESEIPQALGGVLSDGLELTLRWNPGRK